MLVDCLSAAAATDNDDDELHEARDDPAIPTHPQCKKR